MKIWGSDFSRAQRSHWALRELGLEMPRVDVPIDVRTGKIYADDAEMARFYRTRLHPDSRMPVLSGPDEEFTLFESLAINFYCAKKHGCAAAI
jgi:glutathione S-transferase|eukprot:COSAG01_NODE_9557_length_2410_cov_1.923410_4_plen_93_part_00